MELPALYLLRHGQSTWNREERVQGQRDVPLTDLGRAQAAAQGRILASLDLPDGTTALTSPLIRARETAEIACAVVGHAPRPDPRLMEMGFGPWEGLLKSDLQRDHPELREGRRLFEVCMEGPGEGFEELRARAAAVLEGLTGPTVIVSHGITLTMIRALALGLNRAEMSALTRPQGVVHVLTGGTERIVEERATRRSRQETSI